MKTEEFIEMCDNIYDDEKHCSSPVAMKLFGEANQIVKDCENSCNAKEYIDDSFNEDFSEFDEETEPIISDSIIVEFNNVKFVSSNTKTEVSARSPCIKNITIVSRKVARNNDSIENEIRNFFEFHRLNTENISDNRLYKLWNVVYHDNLPGLSSCIKKYLAMRYLLRFEDENAFKTAIRAGTNFIHHIKMSRRLCSRTDISDLLSCYEEEWYDADVFDMFSNSPAFNKPLIELLKTGKYNKKILERYVGNSTLLMCCIRLLLADSYYRGQFDNAAANGDVDSYTNKLLSSNIDRFKLIRNRKDFPKLYELITTAESCGKIMHQDVIDEFAEAYYLSVILRVDAQGRLNKDFAKTYLLEDLGKYKFVADVYENNSIDLSLDSESFFRAKILTDVITLRLEQNNFTKEFKMAYQCLLCSRFIGRMSKIDYCKFLAIASFTNGKFVLELLNKRKRQISSYNKFWFLHLLFSLKLDAPSEISDKIDDNLLIVNVNGTKRHKVYLQLNDYVFDTERFKKLTQDVTICRLLGDNSGLLLTNSNNVGRLSSCKHFNSMCSLTTWAEGLVDDERLEKFNQYNSIVHANLVNLITKADEAFRREMSGITTDSPDYYRVSPIILKMFNMSLDEYLMYDKMLAFIVKNDSFLGILRSKHCFDLLKLFSKAYTYDSNNKVMMMFLYMIFRSSFKDKFRPYSSGFESLDPLNNIIFIKGYGSNISSLHFRIFIDSIDSIIDAANRSIQIRLWISNGTINLEI